MSNSWAFGNLDHEGLLRAKTEIESLIKKKESESKVTLWVVGNGLHNAACFAEGDFNKAKEKLCELIASDEFDIERMNLKWKPEIRKVKCFESEVSDWMELNEYLYKGVK